MDRGAREPLGADLGFLIALMHFSSACGLFETSAEAEGNAR
jgi:hypothetical protein